MPMDDRLIVNELQNGSTTSSLACKSCRRMKLKCDRVIPHCRNCEKVSRSCEYPAVAQKPGPRPGSHRRAGDNIQNNERRRRSITLNGSHPYGTHNWLESGASSNSFSQHSHTNPFVDAQHLLQNRSNDPAIDTVLLSNGDSAFRDACQKLQMPVQFCLKVIETYFANMTAFSLFHQPTFQAKLLSIDSTLQMQALITTMFVFSCRFMQIDHVILNHEVRSVGILESAYRLGQECLTKCSDDTPPLHVLQVLILQAHTLSVFGVRGKAWRLVGQVVRIAYELRLHELDLDMQDKDISSGTGHSVGSHDWVATEEKRRAWWSIWECDVFASTILRLPNAIDWTRNRTNLPSTDEDWFNGTPAQSCRLHVDPNRRWRDLRDSGNTSPTAWFILLNSYKWEALSATQRIAPPTTFFDREDHIKSSLEPQSHKSVFARKRETLENCLRCAVSAVPPILQADSFLTFEPSQGPHPSLSLVRDHGRYMIQVMTQVTQLLISRKDLEGGNYIAYPAEFSLSPSHTSQQTLQNAEASHAERKRWQRCLLVANSMASTVRNASLTHYQFVNPNAATALWMAAATQLAAMAFHRDEIDLELAQSNLDLLTTTIESFIAFWDVPKTLIQSLSTLESQLKALNARHTAAAHSNIYSAVGVGHGVIGHSVTSSEPAQSLSDVPDLTDSEVTLDLSPFDVLQAMDFGAMYNGVENWENLFLDPGFPVLDSGGVGS